MDRQDARSGSTGAGSMRTAQWISSRRRLSCGANALLIGSCCCLWSFAGAALAGDWPQILGNSRNAIAIDEAPLPETFTADSTPVVWEVEVGEGFAGVAVADSKVIVFHRQAEEEIVEARDAATGESIWRTAWEARYQGRVNPDAGPRAVPTIDGERVIVWGAAGVAACLDLQTGRRLWQHDLMTVFRGDENYFGAGSAPLVIDDTVIFNVGGRQGAGIVGLNLATGEVLWKSTDEGTSYAAPVALTIGDETLALVPTRLQLVVLDPRSGAERFRLPFGKTGPTVNAAVPTVQGNRVFVTAAYGIGAMLLDGTAAGFSAVWKDEEAFASQYFTPVLHDGHLYGTDGREDFDDTNLRCVDWETGNVKWSQPLSGAHVILVGDDLLAVSIDGSLTIAKATPDGFAERYRTRVLDSPGRSLPAYAQGRLYVRSNAIQGKGTLRCVQIVPSRP